MSVHPQSGRNHDPAPARPGDLSDRSLKIFFFLLLAASSVLRVLLSVFPKTAVTYNDELFYLEIAQNLWLRGSVSVYGARIGFTKILYSVLISPFYAVSDGMLRVRLISGFNALLLSSSLIPGWFLARRVLKKNRQTAFALLFLALSPNLFLSVTFMAENLYLPLLLWCFLTFYRFISAGKKGSGTAVLLGFLGFLLYCTKETGAAFLLGTAAVLLVSRSFVPFLLSLAGFGVPWLVLKLIVFRGLGYTYAEQLSIPASAGSVQLLYFLYGSMIMALFFLVSVLWYPVAVPVLRRKSLVPRDRSLLLLSAVYALALAPGIAYAVLLHGDPVTAYPQIHLRYYLGAAFPFLLLFLTVPETDEPLRRKSPLVVSSAVFALALLLFFFVPKLSSLVDHPVLHFFSLLPSGSPKAAWLVKAVLVLLLALPLLLAAARKRKAALCLLCAALTALELTGCAAFYRSAREEEEVTDAGLLAETQELDRVLDSLGGNTLLITPSLHEHSLRLINTVSDNDYAVAVADELARMCTESGEAADVSVPLENLPVPFPKFAAALQYDPASVDYVVTVGECRLIDLTQNRDITPAGVTAFRLYQSENPSGLNLVEPRACLPGERILFYGENPLYRFYQPTGFSDSENGYTWSAASEVTLTLRPRMEKPCDLMVSWTWTMTNGEQPCSVWANDVLVREETLSNLEKDMIFYIPAESYAATGLLTLRFVFPEAKEPGNGDPRLLAVAFESLLLEVEN